jgi:hypothetical protein
MASSINLFSIAVSGGNATAAAVRVSGFTWAKEAVAVKSKMEIRAVSRFIFM